MISGKIVIVDDEKIVTSAFKTLLRVEGFSDVNCFNNPEEAVEFLKTNTPDIIISDFLMPQMNGLEFLTKAKELYPEVSMILLTGYADKENAAARSLEGASVFAGSERAFQREHHLYAL